MLVAQGVVILEDEEALEKVEHHVHELPLSVVLLASVAKL
jgi:hypothetical protein